MADPALQPAQAPPQQPAALVRTHLRLGWWSLLCFLSLGIFLEGLHGFKVRWYLDVTSETRRLLWTLAHAHGTLLALIHIGFATTLPHLPNMPEGRQRLASRALTAALLLMPLGFLIGGAVIHGGDPGVGILLLPIGALMLFAGVLAVALSSGPRSHP